MGWRYLLDFQDEEEGEYDKLFNLNHINFKSSSYYHIYMVMTFYESIFSMMICTHMILGFWKTSGWSSDIFGRFTNWSSIIISSTTIHILNKVLHSVSFLCICILWLFLGKEDLTFVSDSSLDLEQAPLATISGVSILCWTIFQVA